MVPFDLGRGKPAGMSGGSGRNCLQRSKRIEGYDDLLPLLVKLRVHELNKQAARSE
jgi:hypothetical protein